MQKKQKQTKLKNCQKEKYIYVTVLLEYIHRFRVAKLRTVEELS